MTLPLDFTTVSSVLTITVPADAVGGLYIPPGVPDGDTFGFPQYPDQPRSLVECCVAYHKTTNSIAATYDPDTSDYMQLQWEEFRDGLVAWT